MRILVVGSHDWRGTQEFKYRMDLAASRLIHRYDRRYLREGLTVVAGLSTTGVDFLAREWASTRMDTEYRGFESTDWRTVMGQGADMCLAFLTGCHRVACKGTEPHPHHVADLRARFAEEHGIPTERYGWREVAA
jgi:hypothetical protein